MDSVIAQRLAQKHLNDINHMETNRMAKEIIMYSAEMCGDCQLLKAFMDANNIEYTIRDIRQHPEYGDEVEAKTGKKGVPYLVIDGEWVCGYQPRQPFSEDYARRILGL